MKKPNIDFLNVKSSDKKEISINFTTNDKNNTENSMNLARKKINFRYNFNFTKNNNENSANASNKVLQTTGNATNLEEIKSIENKITNSNELSEQINIINNLISDKQSQITKIKENNFEDLLQSLENELNILNILKTNITKINEMNNKPKPKINESKINNILEKNINDNNKNDIKNNDARKRNNIINFNRMETKEIQENYEYHGIMTTTNNELCRSRLGNKLLMSLNVEEINKNQHFDRVNLAYPVLQKKKIVFSFANNFNTKKLGKKKIDMNDFNKFDLGKIGDGINTVY